MADLIKVDFSFADIIKMFDKRNVFFPHFYFITPLEYKGNRLDTQQANSRLFFQRKGDINAGTKSREHGGVLSRVRIDAGERFTALYETTKLVKYVIMLDGWFESRRIRSSLVVLLVSLNKLQHSYNSFFQFEFFPFFFHFVFHTFVRFLL